MSSSTPNARSKTLALLGLAVVLVAQAFPIWSAQHLPLGDYAQHASLISIWQHYDDPRYDFRRYYELAIGFNPYVASYALTHALAYLVGVDAAMRVLLTAYVVGTPLGFALLARRLGRDPLLALFVFPLVWNTPFTTGFYPFCLGLAGLPYALVMFDRFCERPTIARAVIAASCGTVLYLLHLLPWTAYVAVSGLWGLAYRRARPRDLWPRLWVWVTPVVVFAIVSVRGSGVHMGEVANGAKGYRYPLLDSLREFPSWVWNGCTAHVEWWLGAAALACLAALFASSARNERRVHELRAEIAVAIMLILYFVMPRSLFIPAYWWGINIRFAVMACMFLSLCVHGEVAATRRWLFAPLALIAVVAAIHTAVHFARADRFMAGYREIATLPPAGSRVLFVIEEPWHDDSVPFNYAQLYSGYFQAEHGGYSPWSFDEGFPIRYRVRYPAPYWHNTQFRWRLHARYYDYVMSFQGTPEAIFGGHAVEVKLVRKVGKWALWKLPGPRADEPPAPPYPSDWATDPKFMLPK